MSTLGLELLKGQLVHLVLNKDENLINLLDEVHFLDHFSLLHLLDLHLLLDLADFPLLIDFDLIVFIDVLCLAPLLPIELKQDQLRHQISPLLDILGLRQCPIAKLNAVLVFELKLEPLQWLFLPASPHLYSMNIRKLGIYACTLLMSMYCWSGRNACSSP